MNRELDRGEVQDRLPDLVHGTLPADERAAVERAVALDSGLARELAAIRAAHRALTPSTPAMDTARIAAAIAPAGAPRRGMRVAGWRIAAAIATLAVGGASLAIVRNSLGTNPSDDLTIHGSDTMLVASTAPLAVSFGYDLSSLSAEELEKLFADLERSGGIPSTEPKTTVVVPPVEETR